MLKKNKMPPTSRLLTLTNWLVRLRLKRLRLTKSLKKPFLP